jgi:quinol monooxygenase YgiN
MTIETTASTHEDTKTSFCSTKAWVLMARIYLKEGVVPEFMQRVQAVLDEMRHEKTFRTASLCAHPTDPYQFLLFEVWEDRDEFFSVQVNREYRQPHAERFREFLRSPTVFEEWHEIRADYAIHARR